MSLGNDAAFFGHARKAVLFRAEKRLDFRDTAPGLHHHGAWHPNCEVPRREGKPLMPLKTTLLDLVTAVAKDARSENEIIATVVAMVNRGSVRLCGSFRASRFDLEALAT